MYKNFAIERANRETYSTSFTSNKKVVMLYLYMAKQS